MDNPHQPFARPDLIGGLFGFESTIQTNPSAPEFFGEFSIPLVNARSGIWLLTQILKPDTVWAPSYLCDSMVMAVKATCSSIRFYEVNDHLEIVSGAWIQGVRPGDLVIFIDYFGFPLEANWAARIKEQGGWVLEDASQALLSRNVGQHSDFTLSSPRKFLGVPDGGILTSREPFDLKGIEFAPPPAKWWLKSFTARMLRRDFDHNGEDRSWFALNQQVEAENPIGPYAMSEFSGVLLQAGFDYPAIIQKRIENYNILANQLGRIALFPVLPPLVTPLGFPVRLVDRDRVRNHLYEHRIYPPVHWPIKDVVPAEFRDSHKLAAEIMTLPCDQRYNREDMDRMAQRIKEML